MIFFKPISREPRTPSTVKPTIIRVPSMRSNASSTTIDFPINSPCPSPFFIPITPKRRSAFSFVGIDECDEEEEDSKMKEVKKNPVKSRTSVKRKIVQTSPEKLKPSPKKTKVEPKTSSVVVRKTRSMDKKSDDLPNVIKKPQEVKKSHRRSIEIVAPPVVPPRSTRVLRSQSFKH